MAEVERAIVLLQGLTPSPPLSRSVALERAAVDHVIDQIGQQQIIGSKGSDGSGPSDRILRHGQLRGTVGENVKYGIESPRDIVVSWLVDDADQRSGRRKNVLNPGR